MVITVTDPPIIRTEPTRETEIEEVSLLKESDLVDLKLLQPVNQTYRNLE